MTQEELDLQEVGYYIENTAPDDVADSWERLKKIYKNLIETQKGCDYENQIR